MAFQCLWTCIVRVPVASGNHWSGVCCGTGSIIHATGELFLLSCDYDIVLRLEGPTWHPTNCLINNIQYAAANIHSSSMVVLFYSLMLFCRDDISCYIHL